MNTQSFDLTTDPWIKVIDGKTNQEETVSLITFFENAQNYRQFAGELRAQDLATLRFLLAILTTVYSRFDAAGKPYPWLTVDPDTLEDVGEVDESAYDGVDDKDTPRYVADLLGTWQQLDSQKHFSSIVTEYLQHHAKQFDLFGDQPFFQVTEGQYNQLVLDKDRISLKKPKGTVALRQINRQISESGNKAAAFSPKSEAYKDQMPLDELVRWLIMYQNVAGVTDKSKVKTDEKMSNPAGWLYKLNPVFAQGNSVFETLMLNMVLVNHDFTNDNEEGYVAQKPVWEYSSIFDYIDERKKMICPNNIAELYTTWARILHINWDTGQPLIFSAGIPMFNNYGAFVEPMTTWRNTKTQNDGKQWIPPQKRLNNVNVAMWRNFGQYVNVSESDSQLENDTKPGIVKWLQQLNKNGLIKNQATISLASAALVRDDNASSQMPAAEMFDDMRVKADVLFDPDIGKAQYWPARIEMMIDLTKENSSKPSVGNDYRNFITTVSKIRNAGRANQDVVNKAMATYYDGLNEPFKEWLGGLRNDQDRDEKSDEWAKYLRHYVIQLANDDAHNLSPRDISGYIDSNGRRQNIFMAINRFKHDIATRLEGSK